MTAIRCETQQDIETIRAVNQLAFGGSAEADLVDRLRQQGISLISMVAVEPHKIVGHILFSPMSVDGHPEIVTVAGLAPLAVLPTYQRKGIGSKLVRAGLKECRQAGFKAVAVLGHPDYYPRFGFKPAASYGIRCEFDAPAEAFMVLELHPGALAELRNSKLCYLPEFKDV